ncbi:MAG: cofactor-independent phosphoglycerate mutase [Clostridia bacterium]|nr:cofactor-independent phosphoglycerate mutase [Clostridia bacterium]
MKSIVFLCDGMADYPVEALGGKTPLDLSRHPNMDKIAQSGLFGLARTVPEGQKPGSDNANLSVFGYDPLVYYTGRSPLEAVNMGIELAQEDVAYRCNTVTLSGSDNLEDCVMADYSAGEITSEESRQLIEAMDKLFRTETCELYPGVSYRHCLVLRDADTGAQCTPPHDISGKPVKDRLPKGVNSELLLDMMKRSYEVLKDHPVNQKRVAAGKNPANCLWFWGEGRKPALTPFAEKFGVTKGGVISAVDLIRGIGRCAELEVLPVDGVITGTFETDFDAKTRAAIRAFEEGHQFVYLHMEGPDECGHHGQIAEKVTCIEDIDRKVIGPVLEYLENCGEDYAVLVMPDHPTPLCLKTHVSDPVPFALFSSKYPMDNGDVVFNEHNARATGLFVPRGCDLMEKLLG